MHYLSSFGVQQGLEGTRQMLLITVPAGFAVKLVWVFGMVRHLLLVRSGSLPGEHAPSSPTPDEDAGSQQAGEALPDA